MHPVKLGRPRGASRRRCTAEQALRCQVLVDIWPVDAESTSGQAPVGSLLGSRRQDAWVPHEWHRDGAAVQEINGEEVVREPDVFHALTRPPLP
jgi:hypothetical protein